MFSRLIQNKKMVWWTLAGLAAAAVILAAGLILQTSAADEAVSAAESTYETAEAAGVGDGVSAVKVQPLEVDASDTYAAKLFACKTEDADDTAAVAKLLETMNMESVTGKYTVKIEKDRKLQILTLKTELPVQQADREAFDANMKKCMQQIFALIPQIDEVRWSYEVISSAEKSDEKTEVQNESILMSMDKALAAESFGGGLENFGESKENLLKLLTIQAGKA